MYKMKYFTETDLQKVDEFMREYPFATIIGAGMDGFPVATQLPLEIIRRSDTLYLRGHLMKGTDHHAAFEKNRNVMALFTGPDCYISASWYTKKNVASTWDYITVQAKGEIIFTDETETIKILQEITDRYETPESPAAYSKLDSDYVIAMAKFVVGFEIKVEVLENTFKLSQNHSKESRLGVIDALEKKGTDDTKTIARMIKERM